MKHPNIHINNTPPELYHVALMGIKAAEDYNYGTRKSYTFYFYNKYRVSVRKNNNGWAVEASEIE